MALMSQIPPRTILIVDDDLGVTETFARLLQLEGYQVRTANNAEAGLKEASASCPDAIILDLRMPLVDGVEFLRRLRSLGTGPKPAVAIVTGDYFIDDAVSDQLRALGAELRFKPLWLEDLLGIVQTLVVTPPVATTRQPATSVALR
jgi:two-component system nitrogen regulation response regulator NtrX